MQEGHGGPGRCEGPGKAQLCSSPDLHRSDLVSTVTRHSQHPGCRHPLQKAPAAPLRHSLGQEAPTSVSWARGLGSLNIKPEPAGLSGPHPPAGRPGARHSTPCPMLRMHRAPGQRGGAGLAPRPGSRGLPTLPAPSPGGGGCCPSGLGKPPLQPQGPRGSGDNGIGRAAGTPPHSW